MKQIGLVGAGYWGKNLARVLAELGALRRIFDPSAEAAELAKRFDVEHAASVDEGLASGDLDAVVIASPAVTHYEIALRAIESGHDVFVEKPLAMGEAEAVRICAAAKENDRVLMVGHLLQYHPAYLKLRELVEGGTLGRLQYIYSHRLNFGKIRQEENILWSFAPHDVSMILGLANEDPSKVEATGHCYLHGSIADITTTHLDFPSGLRAHVFVSWLHPTKQQKLVVVGDRGMMEFDDTRDWDEKLMLYPHSVGWKLGQPEPIKGDPEPVALDVGEPLKNEVQHFLDCLGDRSAPRTDGAEGLRVLRVLCAAQEALDRGLEPLPSQPAAAPSGVHAGAMVHETAAVDDGSSVGVGTKIWHFSHILSNTRIGEHCSLGQNVMVGPNVEVGSRVKIQNNVSVFEGVTIEDGVFCGPSCVFTNVINPRAEIERKEEFRPTRVGRGASIGANSTIVCGNDIGRYALVGAGAVVTKGVRPHSVVVGNPAKHIGWVSEAGEILDASLKCPRTGIQYKVDENGDLVIDA